MLALVGRCSPQLAGHRNHWPPHRSGRPLALTVGPYRSWKQPTTERDLPNGTAGNSRASVVPAQTHLQPREPKRQLSPDGRDLFYRSIKSAAFQRAQFREDLVSGVRIAALLPQWAPSLGLCSPPPLPVTVKPEMVDATGLPVICGNSPELFQDFAEATLLNLIVFPSGGVTKPTKLCAP